MGDPRRRHAAWLAASALAVLAACGAPAEQPPACSPETCTTGCCLGDQCIAGTDRAGCGAGGAQCDVCATDATCAAARCQPACSPQTCAGCCATDGRCLAGLTSAMACGKNGALCQACASNLACAGGACVADTCAATCDGCCQADGSCIPWDPTLHPNAHDGRDTCGRRGGACATCDAATSACADGGCVTTACAASCAGCCQADGSCLAGTATKACGSRGASCDSCGPWACVDAAMATPAGADARGCYLAPSLTFDVVVVDALLPATDPAGASWDAFGGLPDPRFRITACDAPAWDSGMLAGTDPACVAVVTGATIPNTLTPTWATTSFTGLDAMHLRVLTLALDDVDTVVNDPIATCTLVIAPASDSRAAFELFQRLVDGGTFEVPCVNPAYTAPGPIATVHLQIRPR